MLTLKSFKSKYFDAWDPKNVSSPVRSCLRPAAPFWRKESGDAIQNTTKSTSGWL
jgi:hypothetical protein